MDLSILIPARNEMFLARTIDDILENIEADTEVIAVLDGEWAEPAIPQNNRVNVIKLSKSIGQRAATNLACKLSKAKYVMKVDAHCSFDKGFDRKMLEAFKETGDNVTMVPIMRNLWAYDWKCYHCGWKKYQGPTPKKCDGCGKKDKLRRKMLWIGKNNPQSTTYCFDSTPHFQYFNDWKHRSSYVKDKKEKGLTETMSLQGSCWMLPRKKYWELNICDEKFGGWGSQGIEVACKTWLSGGRVVCNHKTWYAHMFRTQGGDFSFPYSMSGKQQKRAQAYAKELFFDGKWDKQVRPLSWLLEKFWPVKGWNEDELKKLKDKTFKFTEKSSGVKPAKSLPRKDAPSASPRRGEKVSPVRSKPQANDAIQVQTDSAASSLANEKIEPLKAKSNLVKEEDAPSNIIQITEGKRLILLDVVDRSKDKSVNNIPKSGATFSIEPSRGIIYYADSEVSLKILVKEHK